MAIPPFPPSSLCSKFSSEFTWFHCFSYPHFSFFLRVMQSFHCGWKKDQCKQGVAHLRWAYHLHPAIKKELIFAGWEKEKTLQYRTMKLEDPHIRLADIQFLRVQRLQLIWCHVFNLSKLFSYTCGGGFFVPIGDWWGVYPLFQADVIAVVEFWSYKSPVLIQIKKYYNSFHCNIWKPLHNKLLAPVGQMGPTPEAKKDHVKPGVRVR